MRWEYAPTPPNSRPADRYGLGLQTSPSRNLLTAAPGEALAPLFVTSIRGGPASRDHIRPGDIIRSVDGAPPFANGLLSQGVIDLLFESYPQDEPVRITFHRPATGRTWTVRIKPTLYQPSAASRQFVTARLLDGNVADVKVSAFAPGVASSVLTLPARHELAADHELINGIGVAPDYYLPRTADDLSTGHDPDLAKALNLLSP